MIIALPPRQHEVLLAVCDHKKRHATGPTLRELAVLVGGRQPSTVHKHLAALVRKGVLARVRGARSLRVCCALERVRLRRSEPCVKS